MVHVHPLMPRLACDSLVALGPATADGAVLFAKNSDRPAEECQPLIQLPGRVHPPGARLRCTYVEIPQVTETARLIGSRPYWGWGLEHGLNEHGVAIGNHTVFTKDPANATGLTGMDLVRLGLERGRSADAALAVMTALLAAPGQGGSGYADKDWPYHNSFLIADREGAWILETSGTHWAARRVRLAATVSNHLGIGDDWDRLSDDAVAHAVAAGWWPPATARRFDFAGAYRDTTLAPEVVSIGRYRRTCALLQRGPVDVRRLRQILRDHYGSPLPPSHRTPADPEYFSVCMHADPVGTTTASMIARLPQTASEPLVYWASFGTPCLGAFIPLFLDAEMPATLGRGGKEPSDDSAWWQFKRLLAQVERDWACHAPRVRAALDAFETDLAARMGAAAISEAPVAERAAFTHAAVADLLAHVGTLTAELSRHGDGVAVA